MTPEFNSDTTELQAKGSEFIPELLGPRQLLTGFILILLRSILSR